MKALPVAAGVLLAFSLACGVGARTPGPFENTAFLDLAEVDVAETFGDFVLHPSGDALFIAAPNILATWDVAGDALAFVTSRASDAQHPVWEGDRLLLPSTTGIAVLTTADLGRTWTVVGTSPIPALHLRFSGDVAAVTQAGVVTLLPADAILAGTATNDDAIATVTVPQAGEALLIATGTTTPSTELTAVTVPQAGEALLIGDVLYATSSDGALVYDLADPDAPVTLGRVGDGFATRIEVRGDLLLVQTGHDTLAADVSDPRDPTVVAHLLGGLDFAFLGDWLCTVDRNTLYVTDLSDPARPVQVRYVDVDPECGHLAARTDVVFVACGGQLHRFEPNDP